jgi:hypothetical protein
MTNETCDAGLYLREARIDEVGALIREKTRTSRGNSRGGNVTMET